MEFADIVGHWNQDAQNYGCIIDEELRSFRKDAWKKIFAENWPQGGNAVLDVGWCVATLFHSGGKSRYSLTINGKYDFIDFVESIKRFCCLLSQMNKSGSYLGGF